MTRSRAPGPFYRAACLAFWAAAPLAAQTRGVAPVPTVAAGVGSAGVSAIAAAAPSLGSLTLPSVSPDPTFGADLQLPAPAGQGPSLTATLAPPAARDSAAAARLAESQALTTREKAASGGLAVARPETRRPAAALDFTLRGVTREWGRAAEAGDAGGVESEQARAARVARKRAELERRLDVLFDRRDPGLTEGVIPITLNVQGNGDNSNASAAEPRPFPSGNTLLERAAAKGVDEVTLAQTIEEARTESEAAHGLERLGLLEPGERGSHVDAFDRHFALLRVWHDASWAAAPAVSEAFPIPALRVARDGVTYFVHGIAHGRLRAAGRSRVRALVARLKDGGVPLYSEQNFAPQYGYAWGWEFLDHRVEEGRIALRPASEAAGGPLRRLLARAIDLAIAPGTLALPGFLLASDWTNPLGWLALIVAGVVNWALLTSLLPWERFLMRLRAERDYRQVGSEDMLHHYRAYADLAQRPASGVADLARVELPLPLKLDAPPGLRERVEAVARRSKAMAEAAAAGALKGSPSGAREVHLLVGLNHAHEVAWRLEQGPGSKT